MVKFKPNVLRFFNCTKFAQSFVQIVVACYLLGACRKCCDGVASGARLFVGYSLRFVLRELG